MNTLQLLDDYRRDGVVRVRGLLSPAEIAEARTELERYEREILPRVPAGDRTFEADDVSVRNLWRMEQHDAYFRDLAARPRITDLVAKLVKGEPVLVAVETFNKPARTGSGVPWHQDNAYFCQSPPDMLTVWIAVDAATIENGAIYYLPGSQAALVPHRPSGVQGNSLTVGAPPQVELDEQFCGILNAGDALIHHCQTMHRSDPNTTEYSRCGLLLVFRGAHTQEDAALKQAYREALSALPA